MTNKQAYAGLLERCPTPWCDGRGGEPYVFERRKDILGVYCPTCCVSTPYFPTREAAIECWNTRPEAAELISSLLKRVGELEGALTDARALSGRLAQLIVLTDEEKAIFGRIDAALNSDATLSS